MPIDQNERPRLDPALLESLHRTSARPLLRIVVFLGLYAVAAAGATAGAAALGEASWRWLGLVPLYLLAAASLHGVSLFTHEAVHGTLLRDRRLNHLLGALCALPVLQNFAAYRVLHLRHHAHLGAPGDPDHYDNFTPWRRLVFALYWGRLLVGYPAYITAIPALGLVHGRAVDRAWILAELALTGAAIAAVVTSPIPGDLLLHGWLLPMLLVNTLVNVRGMSQHTLLAAARDPVHGTRSILTGRVTAFFMCNENLHLEHHLYPGVPWYHLPRLHDLLRPDLESRRAPYIPSYLSFVRDFVIASFRGRSAGTISRGG